MNRRNIFKLLAGAACAAAIELTHALPAVPKMVLNPAWLKAPFVKRITKTLKADWDTCVETFREEREDLVPLNNDHGFVEEQAYCEDELLVEVTIRYSEERDQEDLYTPIPQFIPA